MAYRNAWKFQYTADKLLSAAETKLSWHEGRLGFWAGKQSEVKDKIRGEGIEINESVAFGDAGYTAISNSGRGASVSIKHVLVNDLNECTNKMVEHRAKNKDYDAWPEVVRTQGQLALKLNL